MNRISVSEILELNEEVVITCYVNIYEKQYSVYKVHRETRQVRCGAVRQWNMSCSEVGGY